MPRTQHRTCPLCPSVMLNLSDHLSRTHGLTRQQRQPYLQMASKKLRILKEGNKKPVTEQVIEEKRKQRLISRALLSHHERKLRELHVHLDQGTFPKSLKVKATVNMKTPEGQALVHEACDEVQKMMLIQMVEEQKQALAQAQKEYQSFQKPKEDPIKSLQKELKSLRTQLWALQTSSAENQGKPTEPEDIPKPNSTEIET